MQENDGSSGNNAYDRYTWALAQRDQAKESYKIAAQTVADYYEAMINAGLPIDLVFRIVADFHFLTLESAWFPNGRRG